MHVLRIATLRVCICTVEPPNARSRSMSSLKALLLDLRGLRARYRPAAAYGNLGRRMASDRARGETAASAEAKKVDSRKTWWGTWQEAMWIR